MPLSRILLTLATVVAFSASAGAERAEPKPVPSPQLELVDVFTNTGQALVYDQVEAEYVLLRAGSRLRDFKVSSIKPTQIEVFRASNARLRFVITKPEKSAPTDTLLDPYGADDPTTTLAEPAPATPKPVAEAPQKVKRVRAPAASRPVGKPGRALISRKELDATLDDLERLSREVDLELVSNGTRVAAIGEGTLPYRLGLRRGDVIISVAGVRTTRLEDGADVFVKLSSAKKFDIELIRDKSPLRISVAIQ